MACLPFMTNTTFLLLCSERLNISMDSLYEECITTNNLLAHLTTAAQEKEQWQRKGTAERWMHVLQATDLPNIQAVVSFVLSIPSSTGFVERIFSFMKSKWTDVRNKCSIELIRSELIVSLNYDVLLRVLLCSTERQTAPCCSKKSKEIPLEKVGCVPLSS